MNIYYERIIKELKKEHEKDILRFQDIINCLQTNTGENQTISTLKNALQNKSYELSEIQEKCGRLECELISIK